MKNLDYNVSNFLRNLREKGFKNAVAEDWDQTLERGYLTRASKAAVSGAIVGGSSFLMGTGIDRVIGSGIDSVLTPATIPHAVVKIPYDALMLLYGIGASLFTSFAIADGYEQNRIQILEAPKVFPR